MWEIKINKMFNEDICFLSNKGNKKMLIIFSGMGKERKFDRLKSISNNSFYKEYDILFLKDKENTYYLGNNKHDKKELYLKIINECIKINEIANQNIITIGSSMGGYAAILYSTLLNFKASITGVPQTIKKNALKNIYPNWYNSMKSVGNKWIELDNFLSQSSFNLPICYIETGTFQADVLSAELLQNLYRKKGGIFIYNKFEKNEHIYFINNFELEYIIKFVYNMNKKGSFDE